MAKKSKQAKEEEIDLEIDESEESDNEDENEENSGKRVTKFDKLLPDVKKIMNEVGMVMTLRQIYYQLVGKGLIPNKISEYKALSAMLVKARKNGDIDYEDMEDRTRKINNKFSQNWDEVDESVKSLVDYLDSASIRLSRALYQPVLHIIGLEKQALEAFFEASIPSGRNCMLVVNRGYNSLSQLKNIVDAINGMQQIREIRVSYFGDHDPSGKDIERNLKDQLEEFGIVFDSWEKIGVLPAHITRWNLPTAPPKTKDSRTKNWTEGGCVELDAIPPNDLKQIIKQRVSMYFDMDIRNEVVKLEGVLNRRYKKKLLKALQNKYS